MLFHVFPYHNSTADMHIERPDQPELRNLHTDVHIMDEVHRDAFPFITAGGGATKE